MAIVLSNLFSLLPAATPSAKPVYISSKNKNLELLPTLKFPYNSINFRNHLLTFECNDAQNAQIKPLHEKWCFVFKSLLQTKRNVRNEEFEFFSVSLLLSLSIFRMSHCSVK